MNTILTTISLIIGVVGIILAARPCFEPKHNELTEHQLKHNEPVQHQPKHTKMVQQVIFHENRVECNHVECNCGFNSAIRNNPPAPINTVSEDISIGIGRKFAPLELSTQKSLAKVQRNKKLRMHASRLRSQR